MAEERDAPGPEVFADVARSLLAQEDVQQTLERIVDLAVETIDGCDHAGVTFRRGTQLSTPAASSDIPPKVDAIQYETEEGPCLDAMREHEVFGSGNLRDESRWPNFARLAHEETGIMSVLCFRLFVAGDTLGALNLYSKAVDAFDDQAAVAGSAFAAHAAVALSSAIHEEQMDEALQTRDVIGQAKGILMARKSVGPGEAFDTLRRASQRLNVKLRDVAWQVADSTTKSAPPGREGEQSGA